MHLSINRYHQPALVFLIAELQKQSIAELYGRTVRQLQTANPELVFWGVIFAAALMSVIWFIRHLCVIVAYGLSARKNDHRMTSARHIWLQAAGKIWRFAGIALFDFLFVSAALLASGLIIGYAYSGRDDTLSANWSLLFNLGLMAALMLSVWEPRNASCGSPPRAAINSSSRSPSSIWRPSPNSAT